jgi:hypothetical protein
MVQHSDIDHSGLTGVGGNQIDYVRKTADQTSTSTSFADVTDLTFAVAASKWYHFRFVCFIVTSAAGEGYILSVNGPSSLLRFHVLAPVAVGSSAGNAANHATGATVDNASGSAATAGGATRITAILEGIIQTDGTGGTLALRLRAETGGANSATVQAASFGELIEIT